MHLPSFNDLIPEQHDVYDYPPDQSVLVVGPPGSGKTSMAIWRARMLISPELDRSVVLVTRNRLLAAVALQLAKEHEGADIQSTTMHSYVSKDYYQKFGEYAPRLEEYRFDWPKIIARYAQAGTVADLDHLIIDEGQNLPIDFMIWAVRFKAKAVSVFADENQSTHEGGCHVKDLQAAGFDNALVLTVNHRNTQEIADVIAHFHSNRALPVATPRRGAGFDRPQLIATPTWEVLADIIVARVQNRAESVGVIVYRVAHVELMAKLLRERMPHARIDSYVNTDCAGTEEAIQMRDPGVTILSGESAIGLEFHTLYLQDLDRSLPVREALQARRLYMLCARARDKLVLVNGPTGAQLSPLQLTSLPPNHILDR
ncbi:hypothetical protein DBR45_02815 [Pseudomonas sp. HMWF031]|nr:hypothetical protein DBR45_02815 [Pseudomonas sp. HMWF031]